MSKVFKILAAVALATSFSGLALADGESEPTVPQATEECLDDSSTAVDECAAVETGNGTPFTNSELIAGGAAAIIVASVVADDDDDDPVSP